MLIAIIYFMSLKKFRKENINHNMENLKSPKIWNSRKFIHMKITIAQNMSQKL